ncbi:hypothetical protein EON65_03180, partial [archaeon]
MKYKKTNRKIERERREIAATKSSIKTISRVRFTDKEEDELIELYARLVNIILVESVSQHSKVSKSSVAKKESSSSSSEEDSSSDDSDSEQEDEKSASVRYSVSPEDEPEDDADNEPSLSFLNPVSSSMTKAAFMRKLIRDDRFDRKHHGERNVESAEVVAARLRRSLLSQQPGGVKVQKAQQTVGISPTLSQPLP